MSSACNKADRKRGELSEYVAHVVFRKLKGDKKILHYLYFDTYGIDFLLFTFAWEVIPLQIKSGHTGTLRHLEAHPTIPVIAIPHRSTHLDRGQKRRLVKRTQSQTLDILESKKYSVPFIFFLCVVLRELNANR